MFIQKRSAFALSLIITIFTPAWAGSPVEQAIDKREDLMKNLGKHIKGVKKALGEGGSAAADAAQIVSLTKTLVQDLKILFPENSDKGDSEAKPEIWTQWADFEKAARSASEKAKALHEAAGSGNHEAIASAFKDMGGACKSCHQDYRAEK